MDRKQVDFGREKEVFPLVLIQVKSAAKRTVFDLKNKREKTFLPFKTQLFHIQVVRYAVHDMPFHLIVTVIPALDLIEIAVRVPFFQQGGRVRPFKAVKQILAHLFITLAQGEQ